MKKKNTEKNKLKKKRPFWTVLSKHDPELTNALYLAAGEFYSVAHQIMFEGYSNKKLLTVKNCEVCDEDTICGLHRIISQRRKLESLLRKLSKQHNCRSSPLFRIWKS